MSFERNLLFFLGLLRVKLARRSAPVSVILNITNSCNCRCKHCYASYYNRAGNDMTTENARKIIRDLRRIGCRRISISGGEPFLHGSLEEIIDFAHGLGMFVTVNSNGILVPQNLHICRKVDALAISLDGKPESHDRVRGGGTHAKALAGIEAACKSGVKVHSNTVLNAENLEEIDYILDLAGKTGFKAEFAITISNILEKRMEPDPLKPADGELREALQHIVKRKKEGAPILFSAETYESILSSWNDFSLDFIEHSGVSHPRAKNFPSCPAGKILGIVDTNGALYACPLLMDRIPAKNILSDGVEAAWETARRHGCVACLQPCMHEFSKIMTFEVPILKNYLSGIIEDVFPSIALMWKK